MFKHFFKIITIVLGGVPISFVRNRINSTSDFK